MISLHFLLLYLRVANLSTDIPSLFFVSKLLFKAFYLLPKRLLRQVLSYDNGPLVANFGALLFDLLI